ncbi:MAG: putative electron transfer flavoprotein subunit [Ramalina farinacea]|uniref:Probable electron transfer flavoprotein subunit beta n=1 Tax=Ramalina farinacea TaxID=258253 RepID=A0AA43QTI8_9LECA|nr:putative electron transfer flavoprotein subunit [Ramalina farinacea]
MPPLRILVPVKRVIDYAVKPRVNASHTAIETSGVKHSLNPFDELSIEAAVRMREARTKKPPPPNSASTPEVADILALSAGPPKCADVLRTAMAMGADRSILIEVGEKEEQLEPLAVAKVLANVVEKEGCNLVILGKQSIDDDAGQTGGMLAGLLGWGFAGQAAKISFTEDGGGIEVAKEVDGGVETVRGRVPMVVTTDLRLNEPRYASLPNIMKAKKKEMRKVGVGGVFGWRARGGEVEDGEGGGAEEEGGGGKVEDVDGLVGRLKELGAL